MRTSVGSRRLEVHFAQRLTRIRYVHGRAKPSPSSLETVSESSKRFRGHNLEAAERDDGLSSEITMMLRYICTRHVRGRRSELAVCHVSDSHRYAGVRRGQVTTCMTVTRVAKSWRYGCKQLRGAVQVTRSASVDKPLVLSLGFVSSRTAQWGSKHHEQPSSASKYPSDILATIQGQASGRDALFD